MKLYREPSLVPKDFDALRKEQDFEMRQLKENLRVAQQTIADLRLQKLELEERYQELSVSGTKYLQEEEELPVGGLASMLKQSGMVAKNFDSIKDIKRRTLPSPTDSFVSLKSTNLFNFSLSSDNSRFTMMTRWPDLKNTKPTEMEMFFKKEIPKELEEVPKELEKDVVIEDLFPFLNVVFQNKFVKKYFGDGIVGLLCLSFAVLFVVLLAFRLFFELIF